MPERRERAGPAAGEWRIHKTGDRRPFAVATSPIATSCFDPCAVAGRARGTACAISRLGPIDISLSLFSSPELLEALSREQLAYGIYYGCVIMLLVWSSLVFIAVRDKAFLAYFAYVGTFGLYMLIHNGLAYQYLWPDSPRWGNTSLVALHQCRVVRGPAVLADDFAREGSYAPLGSQQPGDCRRSQLSCCWPRRSCLTRPSSRRLRGWCCSA